MKNTVRLYRAVSKREMHGIFSVNEENVNFNNNALLIDEIYSHVLSSYKLRNGLMYSFTDDLQVALKYLNKNPEKYCAIGYVDVCVFNDVFQLPDGIQYLQRICEFSDWLRLAEEKEECRFVNLNYKTYPVPIIYSLIPGQKSVFSWAQSSREYVTICNGLTLKILDQNYEEPDWCKKYTKKIGNSKQQCKHYNTLKCEIQTVKIMETKRKFLLEEIEEFYNS